MKWLLLAGLVIVGRCEAAKPTFPFDKLVIPVGQGPGSIAVADVNRDGHPDVLVLNVTSRTLTVLLGDGKGHFQPAPGAPCPTGQSPNDIAVGDFNGDGNPDVAIANTETPLLTILLGDGKGGFKPAPHSPFAVDSHPHVHGIAAADFNGDGKLDLVTDSWGRNQFVLVLGDGKGNLIGRGQAFDTGKRPYQRLRSADFNKDGKSDVVTTDMNEDAVSILLGNGKGGFQNAPGSPFPAGAVPWAVTIDDMNKDGNIDLVVIPYDREVKDPKDVGVTVLFGDGKGGFRKMTGSPFSLAGCSGSDAVATGDLDHDGFRDIVVACAQNNKLMLYLGSKEGMFKISTVDVQTGWAGIAVADLNGDGRDDIVVSNNDSGTITILFSK